MTHPAEPTFEWGEAADGLTVRFPTPPAVAPSIGCAVAFLVLASIVLLPIPLMLMWQLIQDPVGARPQRWVASAAVFAVFALLIGYALRVSRAMGRPAAPVEASTLLVRDGRLRVERAGQGGDMDYTWTLDEIADLRLCAAAPDRAFGGFASVLAAGVAPSELVRLSVERPSGEIDDILIPAPGRYWIESLEAKLRSHLRLSSPAADPDR